MDYNNRYLKYKNKYLKYKNKYQKLKMTELKMTKQYQINKYNFVFTHMTKNFNNLKNIIKSGYIKLGSDIPIKDKFLSGCEDEPFVFSNIYFDDLDNLEFFNDLSLIIKPEIIENQQIIFIGGWGNIEVLQILPSDDIQLKQEKILRIKNYITEPYGLPDIVLNSPKSRQHEVRFTEPIDIHKYLEGISIYYSDQDELNEKFQKIKKILTKYNLEDIKIYSTNKNIIDI